MCCEIEVLQVEHRGWGWSSVIPGLGFLKEQFREPYLFHWALDPEVSLSLGPAVVPLRPFCGVMGVAPAKTASSELVPRAASAATWMCASFVPEPLFTCRC
jgi:acetamidase/formamidase